MFPLFIILLPLILGDCYSTDTGSSVWASTGHLTFLVKLFLFFFYSHFPNYSMTAGEILQEKWKVNQ